MQGSLLGAPPRRGRGTVWSRYFTGPPQPNTEVSSLRRPPTGRSRPPLPKAGSPPAAETRDPKPTPSAGSRGFPRPLPPPQSAGPTRVRERLKESWARAGPREGSLPVAAAHLVAEHSWGGGERERGGEWEREGRGADSPGSSVRGSSTGSRPLAAPTISFYYPGTHQQSVVCTETSPHFLDQKLFLNLGSQPWARNWYQSKPC